MLKKISLRWRLTIFTSLLIMICCIGLSFVLKLSAYRMANTIDANVILPAIPTNGEVQAIPLMPSVISEAKHSYLTESFIYTFFAVFIGGILTYYISKKILEPVQVLNMQVKNIEANHLNCALEVPSTNDELSELTQSFNEMIQRIEEAFSMQKRFSQDAAHELRTPLTILQTKIDVFQKKQNHTTDEYDQLVNSFDKQVKRLRKVLTQLLNFANLEEKLQFSKIRLDLMLNEIVDELSVLEMNRNIILNLKVEDLELNGNESLLYQTFYNLIENAIKYNVLHGKVDIIMNQTSDKKIDIIIKDTGIGIPKEMQKHIFEPFYRVDKSRSREMGGNGLGLALVKNIVDQHHGIITVKDNQPKGTIFIVTLPRNL